MPYDATYIYMRESSDEGHLITKNSWPKQYVYIVKQTGSLLHTMNI